MIGRRAVLVPLALTTVVAMLWATPAWSQTPTPEPTETATPTPEPTEEPEPTPTAEPKESESGDGGDERTSGREKGRDEAQDPSTAGGPLPVPTRLSLFVSPETVRVGNEVTARGRLSPGGENQWIRLVDARRGTKIKTVRTDADGKFRAPFVVRKSIAIQAEWKDTLQSRWRRVSAVPTLKVRMSTPLLFGRPRVEGAISPVAGGNWIRLKLRRLDTGKVVAKRTVRSRDRGSFGTFFRIKRPGAYRAIASFNNDNWKKVSRKTAKKSTPLPSLGSGSSGIFVKLLERRLAQLGHHLRGRDKYYGQDTLDAVMAFNKVHGRARVSHVSSSTWYTLAGAHRPKARFSGPRFHIEVNQSKQVLYVVRGGKVRKILHVSTGAPSTPTYDGTYQFWGKIAGYSPNRLYYPSYFHGARAIHGWPEVPPYNASHGCVRVPMWAAKWIYRQTEIGDTIKIYH